MVPYRFRVVLVGVAAALLVGCQQDEIRTYEVPKPERTRLLGAILPHGDSTWFFKLSGPAKTVAEQEKAFDAFLQSLRFEAGEKPLRWTLPDGWHESKGGQQGRYATIQIGPKEPPLELTVTRLGKEGQAANVLANVNRWRNQLALPAVTEEELPKTTAKLELKGDTITVVDITGTGSGKTGMAPPFAGGGRIPRGGRKPAKPDIGYRAPEGWNRAAGDGISMLSFSAGEGDQRAKVTVTPLPGAAGGLEQNLNRWRGQVGLPPLDDAEARKLVQEIQVDGKAGLYADLAGATRRILAVIAVRGDTTWFIKMDGPTDVVAKQKANFEAFVRSLRFGGPGGNDG